MSIFVAWRILLHEKGRNMLATAGISIVVLMIFLQLGFYAAVPKAGLQSYNRLRFDLLMTSSAYIMQPLSFDFPRELLYQALSLPEVESVAPLYQGEASWLSPEDGMRRDLFVIAFNPKDRVFVLPDIERQVDIIRRPDTVLIDTMTKPLFGIQTTGRVVEIGGRTMEIGGRYVLGPGLVGLGVVVTSDLNFVRMFPYRSLSKVNLGLIQLQPGSNSDQVAACIREQLPAGMQIFTRSGLEAHEVAYWQRQAPTGIVFGFSLIVSIAVGIVVLYQALATQVTRHLSQYATLKAMGYTDEYLLGIVGALAVIMASIAFVPAFAATVMIYGKVRTMTPFPVEMTTARVITVFVLSLAMSVASAGIALRILRRADPADLF